MADPFIAEIILFGGNFAPRGWAFCDGQLLPIASNTALFSLIGTIYGGDGRTTFALPDLRGRAMVGAGRGPGLSNRNLGSRGGAETVAITNPNQLASHNHDVTMGPTGALGAQTAAADQHQPSATASLSTTTVQGNTGLNMYSTQLDDTDIEGGEVGGNLVLADAGAGAAHKNMQPFLGINYIIALVGVFPSRN